jgi:hypothetical protein
VPAPPPGAGDSRPASRPALKGIDRDEACMQRVHLPAVPPGVSDEIRADGTRRDPHLEGEEWLSRHEGARGRERPVGG